MMWTEGLRDHLGDPSCHTCGAIYTPPGEPAAASDAHLPAPEGRTHHLLCCWKCGDFTECVDCCLKRHQCTPLHVIESWTGKYWEKVTLASLGLIYQLGHGGLPCLYPEDRIRNMVVLDEHVHTIKFRYCACRLVNAPDHVSQLLRNRWFPATSIDPETCATFDILDFLRLASVHANVNAHNFHKVLQSRTDPLRLKWLPDREKAIGRMGREYSYCLRLKRAGQGQTKTGVADTKPAALAVRCWACPRIGYNMPEGWNMRDEKDMYLFQTILAMDANFRLKNRIRKNERTDSGLSDGRGLFVQTAPYKEHIASYVSEKDISSCIAFAALAEKDTKFTTGLRVSGVGGVICARHEILQPHGLVDLQKGERYANMDYVLCSVIKALEPPSDVVVSYDIGCQYQVNFAERVQRLPGALQYDDNTTKVYHGLPVWHGGIHEESCRSRNSLKYLRGVGRTDGEAIERIWSLMNPVAYATKEMGEGARHDAIEDKGDCVSFMKNVSQVLVLARRFVIASDERDVQVNAFKRVNRTVEAPDRAEWQAAVDAWDCGREGASPFTLPATSGVTAADIRRQLDAEEMDAIKKGNATVHGASQTAFLVAGLQLEAAQRRTRADIAGPAVIPMSLDGVINNRRRAFLVKRDKYVELQKTHMPGLAAYLDSQAAVEPHAIDAELIPLHLPSSIPSSERRSVCADGLADKELKLRVAQTKDMVDSLRKKLHAKQYSIEYRNKHVTGQHKSTRARALLAALQEKMDLDADAYRAARGAVLRLLGVDAHDDYPDLRSTDLQLEGEVVEPDAAAATQHARAGSSQRPRHIHVSTGRHNMSWLWTAGGGSNTVDSEEARRTIACLWSKAYARKERWVEEVHLLREDMRRCLRSLEKESHVWAAHAQAADGRTDAHTSGMRAYALRHSDQWLALRDRFMNDWDKPHGRTKRLIFERSSTLLDDQAATYVRESSALLDLNDDHQTRDDNRAASGAV
ncbi:hypothetical protein FB107DRAFT_280582 [Schizophyllum commune]